MIDTNPKRVEGISESDENADQTRTPRAIRFSESEWKRIKTAANERGISIGGFIRDAALDRTTERSGNHSASFSPGIEELIKHTFRYAFILTSIKRDELVGERRQEIVDDAVQRARAAQAELLSPSHDHPPPS